MAEYNHSPIASDRVSPITPAIYRQKDRPNIKPRGGHDYGLFLTGEPD